MKLLDELLEEFPDLAPQKAELARLLAALEQSKSPPVIDKAFLDTLRAQLLRAPHPRRTFLHSFFSFFSSMEKRTLYLAGSSLALLLALPLVYLSFATGTPRPSSSSSSVAAASIVQLTPGAFGKLSEVSASAPTETPRMGGDALAFAESAGAQPALADKRMAVDESGIFIEPLPYYIPTTYTYTFDGDLSAYLSDTSGTVYERSIPSAPAGSALQSLATAFPALQLTPFLNGQLTSYALKVKDYTLSVDSVGGMWNIFKDWTSYPSPEVWTPLEASDIPADEELFALAQSFVSTWGISLEGYGEPVIAEPEIALARSGASVSYIPESATVVFPSLINDQFVYPAWSSSPTGLRVSINLRDLSVTNAFDALSNSYNASSYPLTQDAELVRTLLTGGGNAPILYEGGGLVTEVFVPVRAPERVLMEYSFYDNGTYRMLFIPALRFALEDVSQVPWSSGFITVPLVQDIAETQASFGNGGVVMPMVK